MFCLRLLRLVALSCSSVIAISCQEPNKTLTCLGQSLRLPAATVRVFEEEYASVHSYPALVDLACRVTNASVGSVQWGQDAEITQENWSQTCWAVPTCVVLPQGTHDVSATLRIVTFFGVKFATRSGGHSPNPGWSSIGADDGGILIDLQRMTDVVLVPESDTGSVYVSVGAGARWGHVYSALDISMSDAVVVGARLSTVGVGGSLLGGGLSHISPRFGLAADNVRSFEVVLANGTIVNADGTGSHGDLFWALKGGGPNFGIVTRYDLFTVPTPAHVWAQINVYTTEQAPAVLTAFYLWQTSGASDTRSNVEIIISLNFVVLILIYTEPLVEAPPAFDSFQPTKLQPAHVALPGTYLTYNTLSQIISNTEPQVPARRDYRGCSTLVSEQLTQSVYRYWLESALAIRDATGANQTFVLQHIGPQMIQYGIKRGGSPLNIPQSAQQWWTTIAQWENAADDELVRSTAINTTRQWQKLAAAGGLNLSFLYMNDASRDQDPLSSYGSASLKRLRQISKAYDPTGVFQSLQNKGFKVSTATLHTAGNM